MFCSCFVFPSPLVLVFVFVRFFSLFSDSIRPYLFFPIFPQEQTTVVQTLEAQVNGVAEQLVSAAVRRMFITVFVF